MKIYKIVLSVVIIIFIGGLTIWGLTIFLFRPTGPIASAKAKQILLDSKSILKDINCGGCYYRGPTTFPDISNPRLECICGKWFTEGSQEEEIKNIGQTLEGEGWKPSQNNSLWGYKAGDITYYKDNFRMNIQVYSWDSEKKEGQYRFIVSFGLMTLSQYDFDKR